MHGEEYIKQYRPNLQKINLIRAMRVCKTPTLGARAIVCKKCDHHKYIYFSCGHSHCPICQSIKREQWVEKLRNEMYNVAYAHIVFTLPQELRKLARSNKKQLYNLILRSSWETIKELTGDENNVGGLPGMISVLHTFGSDMKFHIHTHCLVTFGGYDEETGVWKSPKRKDKIARYRKINSKYKQVLLSGLNDLYSNKEIEYSQSYKEIESLLEGVNFVVHNTKPTIDTAILENYLARYINRVAVSNNRVNYIVGQRKVQMIYNDYQQQKEGEAAPKKIRNVDPLVFIHQFMQHVLPRYFQKSRRYGLHASATKKKYKDRLPQSLKRDGAVIRTVMQIITKLLNATPYQCEKCKSKDYTVKLIRPTIEWIYPYLKIAPRAPPIHAN